MQRRTFLAVSAMGICLSGCLSQDVPTPAESSESPTKESSTGTPVRRTTDDITAHFTVVDGHKPTDDTASATFNDDQVTVTGTMDPSGCNRPTLSTVRYNIADGVIHLKIGTESPYEGTVTRECGNASYDYRSVLTTDGGQPTAVEVLHNYQGKNNRSFTLERE